MAVVLTSSDFRRIALGMGDAIERAHMGHPDFRVRNRIFATLHAGDTTGMVKLTPDQQQTFIRDHPEGFLPESGAWGRQGCTRVRLDAVDEDALGEAITLAWRETASKSVVRRKARAPGPVRTPLRAGAKPRRSFAQLIARYPPDVQTLARGARALVRELLPKVKESVDPSGPYITYGYDPGHEGVVSYLTVSQKGVKLGVARGASLHDPRGLLQGTGTSARHVVLKTPADLRTPGLRPLLRAALAAWRNERA
jgi:hypothetical protein